MSTVADTKDAQHQTLVGVFMNTSSIMLTISSINL